MSQPADRRPGRVWLSLLTALVLVSTVTALTSSPPPTTTTTLDHVDYQLRMSVNTLETVINTTKVVELLLHADNNVNKTGDTVEVVLTCSPDTTFSWNETDHQCSVFAVTTGYNYHFEVDKQQQQLSHNLSVEAIRPGKQQLIAHVHRDNVNTRLAYLIVSVGRSDTIVLISTIIGWLYFVAWSVSFYPQIWDNFRRRSVVGLNFDYVALNLTGFISYSVYNVSLYYIRYVQDQFEARHPHSQIPVEFNDVIFGLHAVFATLIVIVQCFLFERAEQRISYFAQAMLAVIWVGYVVIGFIVSFSEVLTLLEFLYIFSYVKLTITIVKYIPQAWYNYRRKSTIGWSIGNIFLDSTGGLLSIFQMFLNAFNYDDWVSIFLNFTKFGLGAVSIMFDVLFLLQHYVFYRQAPPSEAARLYRQHEEASSVDNSKEDLTNKDVAPINYGAFQSDKL